MDRNDENRDRLRRHESSEAGDTSGERTTDERASDDRTSGDRMQDDRSGGDRGASGADSGEKSSVDKLIDKAQEKGIFQKAEKFVRDRFGGGGSSGRR